MKSAIRHLFFSGMLLLMILVSSCYRTEAPKVMARYVPERMDDFVFENDLTIGRIYGKALEKETISPGIDIWVKMPGELVADTLYKQDLEQGSPITNSTDWARTATKFPEALERAPLPCCWRTASNILPPTTVAMNCWKRQTKG